MTQETYFLSQIATVLGIPELRIAKWISLGHFNPSHTTIRGHNRKYTISDVVFLFAFIKLQHAGMSRNLAQEVASAAVHYREDKIPLTIISSLVSVQVDIGAIENQIAAAIKLLPPPVPQQHLRQQKAA